MRHHAYRIVLTLAAALGLVAGSGCIKDQDVVTCDNFVHYLAICDPNCPVNWDCEYGYNQQGPDTQEALDFCSDCLSQEADLTSCGDCVAQDGGSCRDLMQTNLGLDCGW